VQVSEHPAIKVSVQEYEATLVDDQDGCELPVTISNALPCVIIKVYSSCTILANCFVSLAGRSRGRGGGDALRPKFKAATTDGGKCRPRARPD
jgi:hypothetical protein